MWAHTVEPCLFSSFPSIVNLRRSSTSAHWSLRFYRKKTTDNCDSLLSDICTCFTTRKITCSISTSFNQLAMELRGSIAAFQKIRVLTAKIKLLVAKNSSHPQYLVAAMQRIDEVTTISSVGIRWQFPGPQKLVEAITYIEQSLAHASDTEM